MTEWDAMADWLEEHGQVEWAAMVRDRTVRMPRPHQFRLSVDGEDEDGRFIRYIQVRRRPTFRAEVEWAGGGSMTGELIEQRDDGAIKVRIGDVMFAVPHPDQPRLRLTAPPNPPPGSPASTPTLSP